MANPPDWEHKRINRALDLMDNAGWIANRDVDAVFTGLKMTPNGQASAETFLRIFRELDCRSMDDLESVLGVIAWYLNRDEMN